MTLIFDPERHCYRYWWACLPALPESREAVDWWAPEDDGRASPYRRLKRLWNDPTWFKRPAQDRYRRHEFSSPTTGTHVLVQFWENWTLFHPNEWVPALLDELSCPAGSAPWDACWSYEFADADTGKLTDLTLHLRDGQGHETLFVIEAKWDRDRLKDNPKVGLPDPHPDAYTGLASYRSITDRRMVYLVHGSQRAATEAAVLRHAGSESSPWYLLTWEALIRLQLACVARCCPPPVSVAIQESIRTQATLAPLDQVAIGRDAERRLTPVELVERLDLPGEAPRIENYLLGSRLFWQCRTATPPSQLPHAYLADEPSFPALHDRVVDRRRQRERNPDVVEHTAPLWRLGAAQSGT